MRQTIIETDDWLIQKDEETKEIIIIAYFSDRYHYLNDIHIPYEKLDIRER